MDSITTTNHNNTENKCPSLTEEIKDGSLPILQINPLTIMTSIPSYKPVDDNQENILDSTCINRSQSIDVATSLPSDKNDQINNLKPLSIVHMDTNSIAAWVKSTTHESLTSPIERSPSLPATIIEQTSTRSRRESTVSTLCDQQQTSVPSDTISSTISQNLTLTNDYQRSFSFPLVDQYQHNQIHDDIRLLQEKIDDDFSLQFLPVVESEDSEADKINKLPSPKEFIKFNSRSPDDNDQPRKSPIVSFHSSVSFEAHRKLLPNRQRHYSWNNKNKTRPFLYQRSQSHKIYSRISHKPFLTSHSMPNAHHSSPTDIRTNQSSSYSDNVFRSTSTTNSPSSSNHLKLTNHTPINKQFLSIPSSTSFISSDRLTSNISDASGQSGIESSNVRTDVSEPPNTAGLIEEEDDDDRNDRKKLFIFKQRTSSLTSESSRTVSTESLPTSSSEDDETHVHKKLHVLNKFPKTLQTPADQRSDALTQLKWLLEKKPTINPRSNLGRRKHLQGSSSVNKNYLILLEKKILFS